MMHPSQQWFGDYEFLAQLKCIICRCDTTNQYVILQERRLITICLVISPYMVMCVRLIKKSTVLHHEADVERDRDE